MKRRDVFENASVLADALMERGYGVVLTKKMMLRSGNACELVVDHKTEGYQKNMKAVLRVYADGGIKVLLDMPVPSLKGDKEPTTYEELDDMGLGEFVVR